MTTASPGFVFARIETTVSPAGISIDPSVTARYSCHPPVPATVNSTRDAPHSTDADAPAAGLGDYDAVLAFNLLHLVSDLDTALAGVVQALRPGGLLICKTACIAEMNRLIPWLAIPLMRAIGKAPPVLCFDAAVLQAAMRRHGLEIEALERHGTKGKDIRVFIVARKPG